MKFFKNLSVRGKIISIIVMMIVMMTIITSVGIYFLNLTNNNLNYLVDIVAERMQLAYTINQDLIEIHRAEKNILLSKTLEESNRYREKSRDYQKDLAGRLEQLKKLVGIDDMAQVVAFEADYREFLKIHDQIILIHLEAFDPGRSSPGIEVPPTTPAVTHEHALSLDLSQGKGIDAYEQAAASMRVIVDRNDLTLDETKTATSQDFNTALFLVIAITVLAIAAGLVLGLLIGRAIAKSLNDIMKVADAIANGDFDTVVAITSSDEIGKLATSISQMQTSLRQARHDNTAQNWLKTGLMRLNDIMIGEQDIISLCTKVISELATYSAAEVGAFYLKDTTADEPILVLAASYAYQKRKNLSNRFLPGEGLVGQAALDKTQIILRNIPEEYIKVTSGLGEASPRFIAVTPVIYKNRVNGVVEVGFLNEITDLQLEYFNQAMAMIAINLETVRSRSELATSQALYEELQTQQEELESVNEELEEQTLLLQQSEEKLKVQQEELKVSNEELEERNELLERQKKDIEKANRKLEQTRQEIERKAEELAIASKYKSEFLANMSHELRTPLNSILLLARFFADNDEGNLSKEQVESAGVIYKSGNELLALISDILDLSKIEAGRMDLQIERVLSRDLVDYVKTGFGHMAEAKKLVLEVVVTEDAPAEIATDRKRLEQIIKNLMSNALKFTETGGITVTFGCPAKDVNLAKSGLVHAEALAIVIKDTGIGIRADKQKIVFEAFQQADGGIARKYAGTGLGLSISRELATLLGGEIQLTSQAGQGSAFILYLPLILKPSAAELAEPPTGEKTAAGESAVAAVSPKTSAILHIPDDRDSIIKGETSILVVEDDSSFAKILLDQCHQKGFKCLAAATGEEGLELANKFVPAAIILDLKLPGMDGWAVLETLKGTPEIRHIPVHIMSVDDPTIDAFNRGAIGFLTKPVNKEDLDGAFGKLADSFNRKVKELLVVEDDDLLRKNVIKLIGNSDVHADEAASGAETIKALKDKKYDCMILDIGLPDMTGFELLKSLEKEKMEIPPIIVYTGRELSREDEAELRRYADSIIIKGVRSEDRLLDETALFLHRVIGNIPEQKRKMITDLYDTDVMFREKQVLVVDDDMRNVFALSKILGQKGMKVFKAENGKQALAILATEPGIDIVLMDIMMPEMDGYETMKKIRSQEKFQKLPIIALTAKAMLQDRELCIAAGASDYLQKPVDVSRLTSMMRVWLYR